MFKSLSDNLSKIFDKLTGVGYLTEEHINSALREIRITLLGADVALPVVKHLIAQIKEEALGEKVVKSVTPGQMVVKIVQDKLEEILSVGDSSLNLRKGANTVILMVGLQGSGKTTTSGKIANKLKSEGKKVLLSSLDVYRPAAQDQLKILARQVGVNYYDSGSEKQPVKIAKAALEEATLYDVLILDTAGRLHIDDKLMKELEEIKKITKPSEVLLVLDSLTGQDAINIAQEFDSKIGITGNVLTRVDSDARGGAALSISYVTQKPIKFLAIGEKISDIEDFHADRVASRILGMGDVVSLVEKASQLVSQEESERMMEKMQKGHFDMDMWAQQLNSVKKMGGLSSIIKMIPGVNKLTAGMQNNSMMDDSVIKHQLAIINSMTREERSFPKILNASRKIRISKGAGVAVPEINKLVKQFIKMQKMMKQMGGMDKKALMRGNIQDLLQKMQ
ncbi:MAG: signal recognition particle protein [Rickettsiales bacterium]|nr:signal recognition particle protein [Rickettsiales bacterium]